MTRRSPLSPFALGLALAYVAERTLAGPWRLGLDGAGALLVLLALAMAGLRLRRSASPDGRSSSALVLRCYLVALAGVALYAVTALALPGAQHATSRALLTVAWPFVVLLGLGPAFTAELALASMAQAPAYEPWRVRLAARAARVVVYAIIAFAGANYAASRWNRKLDLSYFHTTAASEPTVALVRTLTDPVRLVLFAPPGNEVMESARAYLESVARASPDGKVHVEVVDQALVPDLARELKVRQNGVLVVAREGRSDTLQIGLDLEAARPVLRKLDAEVQKRLLALTRPPRTMYLTTGHLERDFEGSGDKHAGLADFKTMAESLGITVKRLGLGEGLGTAVPTDAGILAVVGPGAPFLPAERAAVAAYLGRGGRLLVFIEPETGITEDELLAPLGVKVTKALLASDRGAVRVTGRGDSPYYFATPRASSHPSVSTLGQNAGRMAVVVLGAGAVEKRPETPVELRQVFTLHTLQESWLDLDGNATFDPPVESRASRELAVAIEKSLAPPSPGADAPVMRALVVGDADVVSDGVLGNPGNLYFAADALRWLLGDEALAGKSTSEEDPPIVHKRDDDAVWFYGVSFVIPALVLAAGVAIGRRGRNRKGGRS